MRIKHRPADFVVEEELAVELAPQGDHSVYRVEKRDVTTLQVQTQMASAIGCPRSAVQFPALKDKRAVAIQHASVRGVPPHRLTGKGWRADYAGRLDRPLGPGDILINRFALTLRDLTRSEADQVTRRLSEMAEHGLPNYFDEQRFGSFHPDAGFIGAQLLRRDAETALRTYLTVPYPADRAEVRQFKSVAADRWGDWEALFAAAPRPSNYRSVLTFLRDHPDAFRKALNLIPRQLLSVYLEAYQSHLWNRIGGSYLAQVLPSGWSGLEIARTHLPVYRALPTGLRDTLEQLTIAMPHHRATFSDPALAGAAAAVLAEERLTLTDLKARLLDKAYLSRHQRRLLLFPDAISVADASADECFPGRLRLGVTFILPPGSYATLVVRCAISQ